MNIYIYLVIFLIGTFLGGLAIRISDKIVTKQKIFDKTKCKKCGSKIRFYDLIPIIGFLGTKGRCTDCKEKRGISYFFGELLIGLLAIGVGCFFGVTKDNLTPWTIFNLILGNLFIFNLFIIINSDYKANKISNGNIIFAYIIGILSVIQKAIIDRELYLYQIGIYLLCIIVLLLISSKLLKENIRYIINMLLLVLIMCFILKEVPTIIGIGITILTVIIKYLISKILKIENRKYNIAMIFSISIILTLTFIKII